MQSVSLCALGFNVKFSIGSSWEDFCYSASSRFHCPKQFPSILETKYIYASVLRLFFENINKRPCWAFAFNRFIKHQRHELAECVSYRYIIRIKCARLFLFMLCLYLFFSYYYYSCARFHSYFFNFDFMTLFIVLELFTWANKMP